MFSTSHVNVSIFDADGTELLVLDDPFKPVSELGFVDGGRRLVGLSHIWSSPSCVYVWSAPDEIAAPR